MNKYFLLVLIISTDMIDTYTKVVIKSTDMDCTFL